VFWSNNKVFELSTGGTRSGTSVGRTQLGDLVT
jgi:hypothetical protein